MTRIQERQGRVLTAHEQPAPRRLRKRHQRRVRIITAQDLHCHPNIFKTGWNGAWHVDIGIFNFCVHALEYIDVLLARRRYRHKVNRPVNIILTGSQWNPRGLLKNVQRLCEDAEMAAAE